MTGVNQGTVSPCQEDSPRKTEMPSCSNCGHTVAYDALSCPSCGKQKPADNGGGALIVLGLIISVYLSPSLLLNYALGRFKGELFAASIADPFSWIFSTIVWCLVGYGVWKSNQK
jgi:predicted amidophosphoribosyltransferase